MHQEVLLEDRLLLIALIVGKFIRENVGDLQVVVLFVDPKSIEREIVLELIHLQHPGQGGIASVAQKGNKSVASPSVPR